MQDRKNLILFVVLAIPFVAFALLIASNAVTAVKPGFTLPIAGYDPRSLIYGHYMRLRLKLTEDSLDKPIEFKGNCFCLEDVSDTVEAIKVKVLACDDSASLQQCAASFAASKEFKEPYQLYVTEDKAKDYENILRKNPKRLRADAVVSGNRLVIRGLVLDGQRVDSGK
jgi:hypothetical protein